LKELDRKVVQVSDFGKAASFSLSFMILMPESFARERAGLALYGARFM
jgi:hypothetical protein